jgi:hypothetical protein
MASGQNNTINVPLYTSGQSFSGPDISITPPAPPASAPASIVPPVVAPASAAAPPIMDAPPASAAAPAMPASGAQDTSSGATGPVTTQLFPLITSDVLQSLFPWQTESTMSDPQKAMRNLANTYLTAFNALNKKLDDLQITSEAIFTSVDSLAPAGTTGTGTAETSETNYQYGGRRKTKRKTRKV